MNVFVVQKDGGKTPIRVELLAKLVKAGKLAPDTLLEINGETKRAIDFPELAQTFVRLGFVEPPSVPVPPKIGTDAESDVLGESEKVEASERFDPEEIDISRLAVKRVDSLYKRDASFFAVATSFAALACLLLFGEIVARVVDARSEAAFASPIFALLTILALFFAFCAARARKRADAILREAATIRIEKALEKSAARGAPERD